MKGVATTPRIWRARVHSGGGRIARLRMRPMILFETGHSTGEVSLQHLLDGVIP